VIESTLEDAENGLPMAFRMAIIAGWQHYLSLIKTIRIYDDCLEKSVTEHPACQTLLKLEGVGILNAVSLYIALGCADLGIFNKGKDASP
jgi:transposase